MYFTLFRKTKHYVFVYDSDLKKYVSKHKALFIVRKYFLDELKSGTKARTEVCDNERCKRSLNSVNINKSTQQSF